MKSSSYPKCQLCMENEGYAGRINHPARLKDEMEELKESIAKHALWVDSFMGKYDMVDEMNIDVILQNEIGEVFKKILECAGVYKRTEDGMAAFERFIACVNENM